MENEKQLEINKESIDLLVANVIPTTKYFESRFDHMQYQIDELKNSQNKTQEYLEKKLNIIDARFDSMQKDIDARFEKVDKRFEKIDARFEKIDQRFQVLTESIHNVNLKIEKLTEAQNTTIRDYIIERDRHYDVKFQNLRMFNIAIIALVSGIMLKIFGVIQI